MGLLDKIKGMLGGNADKVKEGIDKAGDIVDEKTGGEFTDKIDMAEEKIGEVIDDQAEDDA
ncbi:MAG: antitoxin [Ilumatobacter sp.]